jgi:hypothetical protein
LATTRALQCWLRLTLAVAFGISLGCPAHAEVAATRWRALLEHDGVAVVVNQRALPRAWLVSQVDSVSARDALRMIRGEASDFEPERSALLEVPEEELPIVGAGTWSSNSVKVRASTDGRIVIDTDSRAPSFLVVSESYFPGWQALVDGKDTKVFQTDYILLGVPVPAGSHHVEMHYAASGAKHGAIVSLVTLVALLGLAVYSLRRKRASISPRARAAEAASQSSPVPT